MFLKLTRKLGWIPEFYNESSLPEEMPEYLKQSIKENVRRDKMYRNLIWVSCEGINPSDAENIGPISYHPHRGFPGYFYPCTNEEECLDPLIAIHFERPTSKNSHE